MSDYSLVQRGVITVVDTDTSPVKVNLGSAIKLSSSFVVTTVRDNRSPIRVERFGQQIDDMDTSPKDVTVVGAPDAWDSKRVSLGLTWRQDRASQGHGITGTVIATTQVRLEWPGTLVPTETIDVEVEVVERVSLGATVRLINEAGQDKVEVSWHGKIQTGDTIAVAFEVFDIENLGDDIKELLFRGQLVLGHLGENVLQDSVVLDDAGNMVGYRKRIFDSKANAELAEADIPDADPLEAGELSRVKVTQSIEQANNDRDLMTQVVLLKAPTPGVN